MANPAEQFPDMGESKEVTPQQQKTEGERTMETKERELLPAVFVIYRENDLYEKYAPDVVTRLRAMDRRVEIQAFSRDVDVKERKRWAEEHKEEFKGKGLLLDGTCWGQLPDEGKGREYEKTGLDDLFDKVISKTIWGEILGENPPGKLGELLKEGLEFLDDGEVSEGEIHDVFVSLVKQILEQRENMPEKVYISPDRLLDHEPFRAWKKNTERMAGKTPYQIEKEVANEIKRWLIEAGISDQSIQVTDDVEEMIVGDMRGLTISKRQEKIKEAMKELRTNTWFVSDRHYGRNIFEPTENNPIEQGKVLYLPLGSFYHSAVQVGLLKPNDETLKGEMDKALQEKFGNKPE